MTLANELREVIRPELCEQAIAHRRMLAKVDMGKLLRAENPRYHVCVMFVPYIPTSQRVLAVLHKKAAMWLFPGGHIEPGETLLETLAREADEEVGHRNPLAQDMRPFMLSITDGIQNEGRECKSHFDVWYLLRTSTEDLRVTSDEFLETKWVGLGEANSFITDRSCRSAMDRIA